MRLCNTEVSSVCGVNAGKARYPAGNCTHGCRPKASLLCIPVGSGVEVVLGLVVVEVVEASVADVVEGEARVIIEAAPDELRRVTED